MLSERSGKLYAVDVERGECECEWNVRTGRLCRHLRAVSEYNRERADREHPEKGVE